MLFSGKAAGSPFFKNSERRIFVPEGKAASGQCQRFRSGVELAADCHSFPAVLCHGLLPFQIFRDEFTRSRTGPEDESVPVANPRIEGHAIVL